MDQMRIPGVCVWKLVLAVGAAAVVGMGWYLYGFFLWNAYPWLTWVSTVVSFFLLLSGIVFLALGRSKQANAWIPKKPGALGAAMMAAAVGAILLIRATPSFPAVSEDFQLKLVDRERVARSVLPASQPGYHQHVLVPADRHLVTGDNAFSFKDGKSTWIFFPVLHHAIDNSFGFVFSESGERPPSTSFGDVTQCRELQPNWFWISTT